MDGDTTTPATGATPDPFGLDGARLEGRYDIQSVVAEGGFGVVSGGLDAGILGSSTSESYTYPNTE